MAAPMQGVHRIYSAASSRLRGVRFRREVARNLPRYAGGGRRRQRRCTADKAGGGVMGVDIYLRSIWEPWFEAWKDSEAARRVYAIANAKAALEATYDAYRSSGGYF